MSENTTFELPKESEKLSHKYILDHFKLLQTSDPEPSGESDPAHQF